MELNYYMVTIDQRMPLLVQARSNVEAMLIVLQEEDDVLHCTACALLPWHNNPTNTPLNL